MAGWALVLLGLFASTLLFVGTVAGMSRLEIPALTYMWAGAGFGFGLLLWCSLALFLMTVGE